jgi:diguanylate cyclase (GGDEF)-like protein
VNGARSPRSTGADERLAGLVRLARILADARSVEEVAERAAEEGRFAFGADSVSLGQLEREHGIVRVVVTVGALVPFEDRFPVDEQYRLADFPLLGLMVDEARPWHMRLDNPDAGPGERELLERLGATSALATPVLSEGRVWGELFATRGAGVVPFDDDDLAFAQAFAGMVSSGLAQVEYLARVEHLAYHDPLTGLGNRRLVEEELEAALDAQHAGGPPVTVVMADVNRLKQANDRFGHEAGDRALVAIANALSLATGTVPGAVAGRIGGDEFCAVLPGYGSAIGEALAAAFLRGTADAPYGVSVACGLASTELEPGRVSAARLFALADGAQYEAKRAGAHHPVIAGPASERGERRSLRGRGEEPGLLDLVLDALDGRDRQPPAERIGLAAAALAGRLGAAGWVVSRLRGGAALPVVFEARREGAFVTASVPAPARASWLARARSHGTVVGVEDEDVPLAAVRGSSRVVVAASGDWLVELLCDGGPPPVDAPAVLRAALGVALGA